MNVVLYFLMLSVVFCIDARNIIVDQQKTYADLQKVLHEICVKEVGVDEAIIEKYKREDFVNDRKMKCYIKCVLKEISIIDENGKLDEGPAADFLPDDIKGPVKKILGECSPKAASVKDHCEKSFALFGCAHQIDPKNFYAF